MTRKGIVTSVVTLGAGMVLIAMAVTGCRTSRTASGPAASSPASDTAGATAYTTATTRRGDWTLGTEGETTDNGAFVHSGKKPAVAQLKDAGADNYILTGKVLLPQQSSSLVIEVGTTVAATKPVEDQVKPANAEPKPPAVPSLRLGQGKNGQLTINAKPFARSAELGELAKNPIEFTIKVVNDSVAFELDLPGDRPVFAAAPQDRRMVRLTFANATVSDLKIKSLPAMASNLLPVSLEGAANAMITADKIDKADQAAGVAIDPASLPQGVVTLDGIPFCLIDSAEGQALVVGQVKAPKRAANKAEAKLPYTGYAFELPSDQYSAIHLLAFSRQGNGSAPEVTVRVEHKDNGRDISIHQTGAVPLLSDAKSSGGFSSIPVKLADGSRGYLHHVRIPLAKTGNMVEYPTMGVEFGRYSEQPFDAFLAQKIGPPSGAVILGATMERSAVEMKYTTAEYGNIFFDTQKAVFNVQVTNRSDKAIAGKITAQCSGPGDAREQNAFLSTWTVAAPYTLQAGEAKTIPLDVTPKYRGTFFCTISTEAAGQVLQLRETSFASIAPDTRKAMEDSPFGIWCFWGSHTSTQDPLRSEKLASLIYKGGWRWTYGGHPGGAARRGEAEDSSVMYRDMKDRFKLTWNCQYPPHAKGAAIPETGVRGAYYEKDLFEKDVVPWLANARKNGFDPTYIVLHENRINVLMLRRYSEYFGGEPYDMPAAEKEKYDIQFKNAVDFARAIKQADPQARIVAFNDYPAFVNEHLKRGFPADAFDVIGLESAIFHHQPERQPDWLCLLGTLHQIKMMQEKYGYHKPVWTTEALYHSTKPGRFDLHDQATVAVREAMLALAMGVERMAAANEVVDCSDDYAKSGWGTAGMCFRDPEYNPKPSFGMYSWMTQVLDQAKYAGKLKHDSTSLHVLDFKKADGSHVYPMWVVSGRQTVTLKATDNAVVYDCYGNKLPAAVKVGQIVVQVSNAPIYVTGTTVSAVTAHEAIDPQPQGQLAVKPQDLTGAMAITDTSEALEKSGDPHPIKGQFKVASDQRGLAISLLKDSDPRGLIPRYGQVQLAKPIELPGRPFALDLHINGNGGWGEVMLELVDANGKVWTSCKSGSANNVGRTFITFDGWNNLRIFLPGQYANEKSKAWPGSDGWELSDPNAQGDAAPAKAGSELAYPLKLTKIIVTMRPTILYVDEQRALTNTTIQVDRINAIQPPDGM